MDNDHGITGELREYACMLAEAWNEYEDKKRLLAIADRIDAEHEKAMSRAGQLLADAEKDRDDNYANWQECKQKVLQHNITMDELSAEIERLKDELAHRIELPKDADGKTWHIGDFTESGQLVYKMYLDVNGWSFYGLVNDIDPSIHRHYQPPTVEDVLRELVDEWVMANNTEDEEAAIAECAKKLQLRGDKQ